MSQGGKVQGGNMHCCEQGAGVISSPSSSGTLQGRLQLFIWGKHELGIVEHFIGLQYLKVEVPSRSLKNMEFSGMFIVNPVSIVLPKHDILTMRSR